MFSNGDVSHFNLNQSLSCHSSVQGYMFNVAELRDWVLFCHAGTLVQQQVATTPGARAVEANSIKISQMFALRLGTASELASATWN
jgi:hypothetical protein